MSKILYAVQVTLIVYILFGIWLYFDQRSHIYHPNKQKVQAQQLPGFKAQTIKTADGTQLTAWLHPGKPMLVYFQGNSGHSGDKYKEIKPFVDHGWGVLLTPYHGYGGNPGTPTETNLYHDAEATLSLIRKLKTNCILLMGRSLGTGVATYVARKYHAAALILITPFTSVADVAASYYPVYPTKWLTEDKYDSLSRINLVNMPTLVIHGTADKVIPYQQGLKLYQQAVQPKHFVTLNGLDHNDIPSTLIAKAVVQFTKPYLKKCRRRR